MLRWILRRLVRLFRRLLRTSPQSSPQRGGSQIPSPALGEQKGVKTHRFSDAEYEPLFMQLLDGVSQGWSRGKVQGFLIAKNLNQADFMAWLQQFGERLRESAQPNQELVRRMVLLSQVGCEELSDVAGEITRDLLSKSAGTVPTNSLDDADIDEAEVWLNQGNQQAMAGDLLGAVASYSKALEIRPDYDDAWVLRGAALADLGEFEQALASYDQVIEIQLDYHYAWYGRGITLRDLGQYEEAIASYDKAIEIKADYHDAWQSRGVALRELGQYEEAIASYDKAIEIKADYHDAWQNRGVALGYLEEYEQALASYNRAIEIKPDYHDSWYGQGFALHELGRIEEAITSYNKAIEIKPDFHEAWNTLGNALHKLGRIEEALASYDQAVQIQPNFHEAWSNQGLMLYDLGQFEQALASYNKAIEIQPDYHEAWNNQGNALNKLGQFEQALASFDQVRQIQPEFYQAWYNRGNALHKLGRIEQALASYDQAVQIQPNYHEVWNNRGIVLCKLGQFEQALASFDQVRQIQPDAHQAWCNQGVVLYDLGQFEQALASYDQALQIQPDFQEAWHNRGNALGNLGKLEEAIASYDKAVQIQPDYHDAWINRGMAVGNSPSYDPQAAVFLQQQFPASPPVTPNLTLTRRRYDGKLLSYQEGLKHCHQDTHPEGWGKLHQAIGKAHYSQGRSDSNYRYFWRKAVDEYHQALITLTKEAFPEQHLEVVQDLIRVLIGLGKDAEAKQWRLHGLEVFEDLLNSKKSSFQKRQLEVKFSGFSQMRVDVLVEDGELVPALRAAERNKNLCLTWILDAQKEHILSPSYQQIQQLVNPTTAIVYWHLSPFALTTFIIKHGAEEPIVLSFPPLLRGVRGELRHHDKPNQALKRLRDFENWVNDWNQQYQDYRNGKEKADPPQPSSLKLRLIRGEKELVPSWRDNLPKLLRQLGEILNIPAILSKLTDIKQLILIPHRDLHRFPLHALFPDTFTITYLPSAQIGLTSSSPPLTRGGWGGNLLSIEHPNSENFDQLPHAEIESAAITQLFNNCQRLAGKDATKTVVETALRTDYNIFHFTGHGTYDFNRPNQSSLILSGPDKLTLAEICKIPLSSYQLVSLSACETALTGNQTIETEYVGLVSAFVYHRVSYVISTLWTVESAASALFMIKCYRLLKKSVPEAVALRKTQQWLRQLTVEKLARLYRKAITQLPANEHNNRPFLKTELRKINRMEPTHKPYEHPYHWAAFTLTGFCKPDTKNNPRFHSAKVKTPDV